MTQDTNAPLISVVIATYKGDNPAFLREAVTSVLEQTHKQLEIIVVVDGPLGDESAQYLEAAARCDPRVRLVTLAENAGPATARNAGIADAKGEYIAILDADDRAAPERLSKQLAYLIETGSDLVGSKYRLINAFGTVMGEKHVPLTPKGIRASIGYFNPIANSTVFARASVMKHYPYRDCDGLGTTCFGEDYDLWVRLLAGGQVLANHPEFLVEFRTGNAFVARRRGWRVFRSDLRTKLRALRLYALWARPMVAVACVCTSAMRLAPGWVLRGMYAARNAFRFGGR